MQPSEDQTENKAVVDSSARSVQPSITIEPPDSSLTSQKTLDALSTDELDDLILDTPELPEIRKTYNLPREEARSFVQHLVRQSELDEEAYMPSSDDHLLKQTQGPLLRQIKRLEEDNLRLEDELEDADATTTNTPEMIRRAIKENTRLLLDIRKELTAATKDNSTNVGLTVDVGSIFNEALNRAREVDAEITVQSER